MVVIAKIASSISRALERMINTKIIDDRVLDDCLCEIKGALIQADLPFERVRDLEVSIKKLFILEDLAGDNRTIIRKAVYDEICKMLDTGKPTFTPKRGKTSVVMFVGLQGSGKTTACTKYAYYYQKKGLKPALVCADTFRADAFDQLKQNATKADIRCCYGSYTESDPVRIVVEGVERSKREKCNLIIVDTSGHHKQGVAALVEEMRRVSEATKPDLVIFVMDSSIGQASAFDQAQAFKQSFAAVGAVIITKMDGHAHGYGALSAVAATKTPVIFIGTGKDMDEFEVFKVQQLVSRCLVLPMNQQPGPYTSTLRFMYGEFLNMLNQAHTRQALIPGYKDSILQRESYARMKRWMMMMDSMTNEELDSPILELMNKPLITRIARACDCPVRDVEHMLKECNELATCWGAAMRAMFPHKQRETRSASFRSTNTQQGNSTSSRHFA